MSLKQKVHLEVEGHGEFDVVFDGRDIRQWELKYRRSAISEPVSIGQLTFLGWAAAKRQGLLNGSFDTYDKFDAACIDVQDRELEDPVDEEDGDGEGPTQPPDPATQQEGSES